MNANASPVKLLLVTVPRLTIRHEGSVALVLDERSGCMAVSLGKA